METIQFYGCVQCQKYHYEGTPIYDEHIRFQSKDGLRQLVDRHIEHVCIDEYVGRIINAAKKIKEFWSKEKLSCAAVKYWNDEAIITALKLLEDLEESIADSILPPPSLDDYEPPDDSDEICQSCGDPDCNRPFPHAVEAE